MCQPVIKFSSLRFPYDYLSIAFSFLYLLSLSFYSFVFFLSLSFYFLIFSFSFPILLYISLMVLCRSKITGSWLSSISSQMLMKEMIMRSTVKISNWWANGKKCSTAHHWHLNVLLVYHRNPSKTNSKIWFIGFHSNYCLKKYYSFIFLISVLLFVFIILYLYTFS